MGVPPRAASAGRFNALCDATSLAGRRCHVCRRNCVLACLHQTSAHCTKVIEYARILFGSSVSRTPSSAACKWFDSQRKFAHNARFRSEGFPSGQRGQTVNLLAQPSKVRILPPPPTLGIARSAAGCVMYAGGGSSMVEPQPSKLMTRVRFPFAAPDVRHFIRQIRNAKRPCSSVAEHSLGKGEVARSIRAMGTRIRLRHSSATYSVCEEATRFL